MAEAQLWKSAKNFQATCFVKVIGYASYLVLEPPLHFVINWTLPAVYHAQCFFARSPTRSIVIYGGRSCVSGTSLLTSLYQTLADPTQTWTGLTEKCKAFWLKQQAYTTLIQIDASFGGVLSNYTLAKKRAHYLIVHIYKTFSSVYMIPVY